MASELEEARALYESRVRPEHWPLFTDAVNDALTSPPATGGAIPAMGLLALVALVALGVYLVLGR